MLDGESDLTLVLGALQSKHETLNFHFDVKVKGKMNYVSKFEILYILGSLNIVF